MPRNRELMRIFHDLDMVEQLGSGMRRILRSYDEKAFSFTDHFMRTSFYFERFQRLGDRIKLTETESLIYAEIKRNPSITVPLLMHETGYSEPTINRALKALREKSCIARVGARKNGRWEALK
ncbi:MAG: winged helix-turn-helix transcriptional regulator [Fibrobacter sp.]|nr:winged helix-turn-helix transcriptional regulator [Fibrobacter sp.]